MKRRRTGEWGSARAWPARRAVAVVCAAAAWSACAPTGKRELTLQEVVARTVQAQGGAEVLAGVESVFRQRNERLFTVRKRPNLHVVVLLDGEGGVRYAEGFDGKDAWEVVDDGPKRLQGERARTALWHATQFPSELMPLSSLAEHGHTLELMGRETVGQTEYIQLRLTLSDGFERVYSVNPDSYRIERARDVRRFHAYEDAAQPIEAIWGDYREVEGVWLPFSSGERNYETGEKLSEGHLLQVRLNVPIADEVFAAEGSLAPLLDYITQATGGSR